jgi:hypothetical protein
MGGLAADSAGISSPPRPSRQRSSDLQLADLHPTRSGAAGRQLRPGAIPEWRIEDCKATCHLVLLGG